MTTQTIPRDELVAVLEKKAAEAEPYEQLDLRPLARESLDNEVDPDAIVARLQRAGQTPQELNEEMGVVDKRRTAAAVFAQQPALQAAMRQAIDALSDKRAVMKAAIEAVTTKHAADVREAEQLDRDAREKFKEVDPARHFLMDTATPEQKEAKREAAMGRAAAGQRLTAARDLLVEAEAQAANFEKDLAAIDNGQFPSRRYARETSMSRGTRVEHEADGETLRTRTDANLTRAKQAVQSARDDVAGCETALSFAEGGYDAAVEEMLRP